MKYIINDTHTLITSLQLGHFVMAERLQGGTSVKLSSHVRVKPNR